MSKSFYFNQYSDRNYNDPAYKKWRYEVFKRDKFKCKWPGCKKHKTLRAHHIMTWAEYPHMRFEIPNGITLCENHHKIVKDKESEFMRFLIGLIQKS